MKAIVALDFATGLLLTAMVVFSPWAFGTTQPWSISLMNLGGYALGILLLIKAFVRGQWFAHASAGVQWLRAGLLLTTGLILAYVLIAAVNAEFTYLPTEFRRDAHPYIPWLPHSLDKLATWRLFWNWLALGCAFWASHDWFTTDVADGVQRTRRLRWIVFVLALNGGLVALEGILQRSSGTAKLLWFQPTHDNPTASAQFGPYAYRANAAQFFNLIWPPALALWWHLQFRAPPGRAHQRHHWLLPFIILLIVAPLVSASRGGFGIALLQMSACVGVLLVAGRFGRAPRLTIAVVFLLTIAASVYLGGDQISERFRETAADPLSGRAETYRLAARMVDDYPWFGVGPGAFGSVFQVYRVTPDDYWPGQLHNDWLEYLITFGRVGSTLLVMGVVLVALRWWLPGGLKMHWTFAALIWIAIGGCLLHARFDFPLQIYSIQFVFVLLGAALFSLSRARSG